MAVVTGDDTSFAFLTETRTHTHSTSPPVNNTVTSTTLQGAAGSIKRRHALSVVAREPIKMQRGQGLPAAAMCSLVLIGWKPTKGICMDRTRPTM